jgi:hypothetical protein
MERHGRIHTALSWMESRRNVIFACGAFGYGVDSDLTRLAFLHQEAADICISSFLHIEGCAYEESSSVDCPADCRTVWVFIGD